MVLNRATSTSTRVSGLSPNEILPESNFKNLPLPTSLDLDGVTNFTIKFILFTIVQVNDRSSNEI